MESNLSMTEIDQIFVATNYDEDDNSENDEGSLCRYEFLEIIVRIAKVKFYDKKIHPSISQATKHLLEDYILPNSSEVMSWQ
jgi:hypothetical protein